MGSLDKSGEGGLRGRSDHNEIEKVVEKGHFTRHLPEGVLEQGQRGRPPRPVGL